MYLEHFHLTHSPFQEEPDPEIFFQGARREEICQSLILDILAGRQLIKLIGREGSGKTLICRLIIDRLPAEYEVVHIDNPVGAFDDLLRIACIDLGMNPIGKHDLVNFSLELQHLLESKRDANKKIVLIIDEAEKLFLATLERLVRNLNESEEDFGLTIILAGRPGLDANLQQLSVFCAKVDIHAGYYLEALTENETRQYLRFRLSAAGMSREQHEDVFTEGAVAKIFNSARGNLRMINILAEESLQVSFSEESFMVLLDHVDLESDGSDKVESKVIEIYELLRHNKLLAGGLAGAVVLMLLIGFLLGGNGSKIPPPTASREKTNRPIPPSQQAESQLPAVEKGTLSTGSVAAASDGSPSIAVASVPGAGGQPVLIKGIERREGNKLFRERSGASAGWLAAAYRGGYTIQLMMLVSDQAQASISSALIQDEYYQVRDQLYILRKKTNPPTLFVFYGIYDTIDAAREARNNMPVFLRKHQPYPLLISDALKKTEN